MRFPLTTRRRKHFFNSRGAAGFVLAAALAFFLLAPIDHATKLVLADEPVPAGDKTLEERSFEKFTDWLEASRDHEDAVADEADAGDAYDAAEAARDDAATVLEDAKERLRQAERDQLNLPPGSSRNEKIQASSDVDAARNEVREAEGALQDAEESVREAREPYDEAKAETERLRKEADRLKQERDDLQKQLDEQRGQQDPSSEPDPSVEPPGSPTDPGTGQSIGGPSGATGGSFTTSAPVPIAHAGLTQQISDAAAAGRSALDDMADALSRPCDRSRFEAARNRVRVELRNLARIADRAMLLGFQDASLQGVGAAAHAKLNEIAGHWKLLEQLWARNCGHGAACTDPQLAPALASGEATGGASGPGAGAAGAGAGSGGGAGGPPNPAGGGNGGGGQPPGAGGGGNPGGGKPGGGGGPGGSPQPPCPMTPEIAFYGGWQSELEDQIREREEVLDDPGAGASTRDTAVRQLEDLYAKRDYVEDQIEDETDKECRRQGDEATYQAQQAALFRSQLCAPSPGEMFDFNLQVQQLQNLKNAIDTLKTRAQQMKQSLQGMQAKIASIDEEIAGSGDAERIRQLTMTRNGLAQSLQRRQESYQIELSQLLADYQYHLWIVDPRAFRLSEIQRIGEYKNKLDELVRAGETRQLSNEVFEATFDEMESEIAQAEAGGDQERAEALRQELENMKAGRQDWDRYYENKESRLAEELETMQIRNGLDGVGPGNDQEFQEQWDKYGVEGEPFGPVMTAADRTYLGGFVVQYAQGARGRLPDDNRSVVVQFAEELGKETVRSLDPRVFAGKVGAFTVGLAEGTAEGVVGLVQLGAGAVDAVGESSALALGFDDGWIFGTDALETLNGLAGQTTPEGVLNGIVAAGGIIDEALIQIQRSCDPGEAAARLGGRIAGNVVTADALVAAVASKSVALVRGLKAADEVTAVSGAADEVTNVANTAGDLTPTVRASDLPATQADASAANAAGDLTPTVRADDAPAGQGANPADLPPTTRADDAASGSGNTARDLEPTIRADAADDLTPAGAAADGPPGGDANPWTRLAKEAAREGGNPARVAQELVGTRVTIDGRAVELGEYINNGTYGHTFRVAGRDDVVVKVFPDTDLIAASPDGIHPIRGMEAGDELLSNLPPGDRIEFTEILGRGTTPDGRPAFLARKIPDGAYTVPSGRPLNAEELVAMRELYETLRRNGLDWWDGHIENIYFHRDAGGRLRAGTFDPDRILTAAQVAGGHPVVEMTSYALMNQILGGKAGWARGAEDILLNNLAGTAGEIKDVLAVRWRHIRVDPATGRFIDGTWTVEAWVRANPDGFIARQPVVPVSSPATTGSPPAAAMAGGSSPPGAAAGGSTRPLAASTSAASPTGSPLTVHLTGSAATAFILNPLRNASIGSAGPFTAMTADSLMCWSRLYSPIATPLGMWLIPFDTYNPGFFQGATAKNNKVVFVEQQKDLTAQLAGGGKGATEDPLYASRGSWGQDHDDQWGLKRIGFGPSGKGKSAWDRLGEAAHPVTVAVIDTGLDYSHPDLRPGSLWRNPTEIPNGRDDDGNGYVDDLIGWNFVEGNNDPRDNMGHGTHVAGIIAASTGNGEGIAGINPRARIMPLKILDVVGRGRSTGLAEAIFYAVSNGARVINLSVGAESISETERLAVDHAHASGVVVVAAAGNIGGDTADYGPAGLSSAITVAATDAEDRRVGFSNWGAAVKTAAPGVGVLSLRAQGTDLNMAAGVADYEPGSGLVGSDRRYYHASGTSFAAPFVAGVASLLISRNPGLTNLQVERMLLMSADDIEVPGWDQFTGAGRLNAVKALEADPDWYLMAQVTAVEPVSDGKTTAIHVLGTVAASDLHSYEVELGKGESPDKWKRIGEVHREELMNGLLGTVPLEAITSRGSWAVRVVARDSKGNRREARGSLNVE